MGAKTIVVADDRAQKLRPIAASLRDAGFNVVSTRDVSHASRLAAQGGADLLVTNYCLDNSSGVELCQLLRRDRRSTAVPAILVTALGYCVGEKAAAKAGIRRIIPETGHARDVVVSVNEVLNHRRAA
jgi:DNA-binding response OmpR family regulator